MWRVIYDVRDLHQEIVMEQHKVLHETKTYLPIIFCSSNFHLDITIKGAWYEKFLRLRPA